MLVRVKDDSGSYESRKLLDEYLGFHYKKEMDLTQCSYFPAEALEFPRRCAIQCIKSFNYMK